MCSEVTGLIYLQGSSWAEAGCCGHCWCWPSGPALGVSVDRAPPPPPVTRAPGASLTCGRRMDRVEAWMEHLTSWNLLNVV